MPDLWKMLENERRHGVLLWGVVLEGETPADLDNIGGGRRKVTRWERGTLEQLKREIEAGGLDFIAFSPRALAEEPKHRRGIFALDAVHRWAEHQRKAFPPVRAQVRGNIARGGYTIEANRDHTVQHTYRPQGHAGS